MKPLSTCLLYSRDEELTGRLIRISSPIAAMQSIANPDELEAWLDQFGDTVLVADLRAPNCLDILSAIRTHRPQSVIIALGTDRSDPALAAQWIEPFAITGLDAGRQEFQTLLKHAAECFDLRKKARLLEEELAILNARDRAQQQEPKAQSRAPLQNFSKAQRNFDNMEKLYDSIVDTLVDTARVSRAGVFIKSNRADEYVYQAGSRCLPATQQLAFKVSDPFVSWLEMHTHLVARQTLANVRDPEERFMLKQMLDALGAEVIIPLHATGPVQGWAFVGQHATGIPFDIADLENLMSLADHISTTLEKALQFEQTVLQKALAETLLHSIPLGIIACDENAIIRWVNSTALTILLSESGEKLIGQPVKSLGSYAEDLLLRALGNEEESCAKEWLDPRTKRTLSAETRCLMNAGSCVGAMMMLHDVTGAKLLQEKEEQLERAAFWNDLAAGMSHEIRNPLVAIKTFSQLLPERYEDPGFREEFSEQVTAEVDKLNHIIDKINGFANLPQLVFAPLDIRRPIENAVTRVKSEFDHKKLNIHLSADDSALQLNGDLSSLEECFYHLLRNAAENLDTKEAARINLSVKSHAPEKGSAKIFVIISDNGSGIDESVQDKLFSPFSTTKARGLGLGLPIAKRAVVDHNGLLDIETSKSGTSIIITFPVLDES